MTLLQIFNKCATAKYTTIEGIKADYALEKDNETLYLLLQYSNQKEDWINNFNFPAKPYRDMGIKWRAHRGFVKVWKSIIPEIEKEIADKKYKRIITIGYSHGAALACLAQEYIWFNRPDIRDNCYAFAFESPRVFCGFRIPNELKQRWENLFVFRNGNDLITHLPPLLFGFKNIGNLIKLRLRDRKHIPVNSYLNHWYIPKCIKEHDFPAMRQVLRELDETTLDEKLHSIIQQL